MMTPFLRVNDERLFETCTLRIAAVRCDVRTNNRSLLDTLSKWRTAGPPYTPDRFRLSVTVRAEFGSSTYDTPHFRGLGHVVFASWGDACVVVFDILARRASAIVSQRCAADAGFWNTVLLPIAIGVLGAAVGAVPVHCACLSQHGNGVLIAGASGAGKSTLAVALALRGMPLVSDDWTYLRCDGTGNTLTAYGVHAPVKLLPDAAEHFPALRASRPAIALNGELAYETDPAVTFGVAVDTVSRPAVFVFLRRLKSGPPRLLGLETSVATRYLIDGAERLPRELREVSARRENVLRKVSSLPCYLFEYSGNPHSGARALELALRARTTEALRSPAGLPHSFSLDMPHPPDLLHRFVEAPTTGLIAIGGNRLLVQTNDVALLHALRPLEPLSTLANRHLWRCRLLVDNRTPARPASTPPRAMTCSSEGRIAVKHGARTFIYMDLVRREVIAFFDPALPSRRSAQLFRALVNDMLARIPDDSSVRAGS